MRPYVRRAAPVVVIAAALWLGAVAVVQTQMWSAVSNIVRGDSVIEVPLLSDRHGDLVIVGNDQEPAGP